MEFLIDILIDCVHDTWAMLPLLFITYCIIEVFERKQTSASDEKIFFGLQRFGPLIGVLVGLIPQCGFSVLAAMLFVQRNITLGTLVAVMIATSDEAIPILLSNPELYSTLGFVLIGKFVTGIVVGYLVDFLLRNHQHIIRFEEMEEEDSEEYDAYDDDQSSAAVNGCNCCYPNYPLPLSALLRSLRIFVFLFVTSGMNINYASDPYWGEKMANRAYLVDISIVRRTYTNKLENFTAITGQDYLSNTIGVKLSNKVVEVKKSASNDSETLYTLNNKYSNVVVNNVPLIVVDKLEKDGKYWYKVRTDIGLDEKGNFTENKYNFNTSYGYVLSDYLYVSNNQPTIKAESFKID